MADQYTGLSTTLRDSYLKLTSLDAYSKAVQWACFTATPFCKALGLAGFGVDGMKNADAFGAARPTGSMVRYDSGKYAIRGSVFATAPTAYHIGRLGNTTPELVEGGDEYAYAWNRMLVSEFIPDVDVDDNSDGLISIKAQKMEGMKQSAVQGFTRGVLGNSSAPDYGTYGPYAAGSDLSHLISITQTTADVGCIDRAALVGSTYYWRNQFKALTSIGGGGEMDRPLPLRRALLDVFNDTMALAESSNDYLLLASQGAYQYFDRLGYADKVQGGGMAVNKDFYEVSIPHFMFNGNPLIWDPSVAVPVGATASTESIYGIHKPSFFVGIRKENNFKILDWEAPRNHDVQRTVVAHIDLRYTPGVSLRRSHFVLYNMPACPD